MKEKIKKLEEELAVLKAEFEKSQQSKWQDKLVQPKDSNYYYISSSGDDGLIVSYGNVRVKCRKPEYAFATEEQAELIKEKMLLMQEMFAFAHVKNEGWKPDWCDSSNQKKYGINYVYGQYQVVCNRPDSIFVYILFVFGIVVKSKEIAEEMLSIFGERIEKYYNEQY